MSESGGEKPKDSKKKNVFSIVDKIEEASQQRREKEQASIDASLRAEGLAVYSDWDNQDRTRRKILFIKAGKMLDALKAGPALSQEAITEARRQLPNDFSAINYLIMNFKHQQLIDEPNRFWAVLDIFFEPLDKLSEKVRDQFSTELDTMTRFGPTTLTVEDWVRSRGAPMASMPEGPTFQESLQDCAEQAEKKATSDIVQSLDEYINRKLGLTAPLLLALVNEYKNRRKLP